MAGKCKVCFSELELVREYSYKLNSASIVIKEYRCTKHELQGFTEASFIPVTLFHTLLL